MRCLWDTNILSEFLKGQNRVVDRRAATYRKQYGRFTFSAIIRYEVLRGLKAKNARVISARFATICQKNEILKLTDDILIIAADLWAALKRSGQLIGDNDIFVAATALHHGLPLATGNVAHFSRIPNLVVEDWTKP